MNAIYYHTRQLDKYQCFDIVGGVKEGHVDCQIQLQSFKNVVVMLTEPGVILDKSPLNKD